MDSICWIDPQILEKFKKEFDDFDFNGENLNPIEESDSEEDIKTPNSPLWSFSYWKSLKNLGKINEDYKRLKSTPKKIDSKVSFKEQL